MTFLLCTTGALVFVSGVMIFQIARSAIHEIEAGMLILIAAVLLVAGIVCEKLDAIARRHDATLAALKGLQSIGLAELNKPILEKKAKENRAPGGTCPNCGSTNTESSSINGKLYGVRCHDCLQSFKS